MTVTMSSEAMVEKPRKRWKGARPNPKAPAGVVPAFPPGWGPLGPPGQLRPDW